MSTLMKEPMKRLTTHFMPAVGLAPVVQHAIARTAVTGMIGNVFTALVMASEVWK
jgi:hypothetical protein